VIDLRGRSVLVVGAGKGIGRVSARLVAGAGAHTVVLDRHADRALAVCEEIRTAGGRADHVVADVMNRTEIESAVAAAEDATGGLDTLVNITGSATWVPLLEMPAETLSRDLAVNLDQHLHVARALVRRWLERGGGGTICVVASISGAFGAGSHAAYGAGKAGLLGLVRSAAEEWWPHGIRVNAVAPGSVRTPRIEETLMREGDAAISADMLSRMASPEDVAGAIAFLISEQARKITGQSIVVDGGTTSRFPYALT
jgi:NAD(P)-dependent dehydrogenase (short-subunit alcohol dehydrogenase family)